VTGFGADVAKGRVNCSFVNLRVTIRLYQGTLNVIELHGHRLIIDSHSSTNPENLAKIGQVDFETIGLTGIVKNKKIRNSSKTYSPPARFQQPGGLNKTFKSVNSRSRFRSTVKYSGRCDSKQDVKEF